VQLKTARRGAHWCVAWGTLVRGVGHTCSDAKPGTWSAEISTTALSSATSVCRACWRRRIREKSSDELQQLCYHARVAVSGSHREMREIEELGPGQLVALEAQVLQPATGPHPRRSPTTGTMHQRQSARCTMARDSTRAQRGDVDNTC